MILIKSQDEIGHLREANRIVAEVFRELCSQLRPGITTKEIEYVATDLIKRRGGEAAFKGYHGFPGNICTSINEEVVHGIPGKKRLKEGDVVSIDIGVKKDDYYGDAALTLPVGRVSREAQMLLEVAQRALYLGIKKAQVGNRLFDISHAIQRWVEGNGFSVVRDFVGHGVGHKLHEEPQLPNFGEPHQGPRLREGMVLAIEPMVNAGGWEVETLEDRWTVVTRDRSLSAHFEHSVAITRNGPEILSKL